MSLPMLQVALDNQTMDSAYETTRLIAEEVDIIEVGTILCVGEGVRAVRDLKALYPHKIVLADAKIADAGKILSRMCFEANADWVTVICCADINTAKGALDVAKEFNGDVQIELTGYWTWEQAQQWRDAGIQQVVYHRSRDAQAAGVAWGEADITAIKRLSDMGFKVTVTGAGRPAAVQRHSDPCLYRGAQHSRCRIAGRSRTAVQTLHCPTVGLRSGYAVETNSARHL